MVKVREFDYEFLHDIDGNAILKRIERIARTCYKSEGLICEGSDIKLISKLMGFNPPHLAMIEHGERISILFHVDRGVGNEIIRQRLTYHSQFGMGFGFDGDISYAEKSTRWLFLAGDKFGNEITVVRPCSVEPNSQDYKDWLEACIKDEEIYIRRIKNGVKPQIARGNLPLSLYTEIVITTNLTEWLYILNRRTDSTVHPDLQKLMLRLLRDLHEKIPVIFDSLYELRLKEIEKL